MMSWFNKRDGWNPVKELMSDLMGRTRENAPIFDMISKVRATVQQVRQQFRDELPVKLNQMFKKPVSQSQWTAMFKTLGRTDLAAITGSYGVTGALEMVTDAQRRAHEIQTLEAQFNQLHLDKAKQLAHYMVTGEHGTKLLRNAYAIAALTVPPGAAVAFGPLQYRCVVAGDYGEWRTRQAKPRRPASSRVEVYGVGAKVGSADDKVQCQADGTWQR